MHPTRRTARPQCASWYALAGGRDADIDMVVEHRGRVPDESVGGRGSQEYMPEHCSGGRIERVEVVIPSPDVDHRGCYAIDRDSGHRRAAYYAQRTHRSAVGSRADIGWLLPD